MPSTYLIKEDRHYFDKSVIEDIIWKYSGSSPDSIVTFNTCMHGSIFGSAKVEEEFYESTVYESKSIFYSKDEVEDILSSSLALGGKYYLRRELGSNKYYITKDLMPEYTTKQRESLLRRWLKKYA